MAGGLLLGLILFTLLTPPLSGQSGALPLSSEISRLERLSLNGGAKERYDAFMDLARLHRLAGNQEAALASIDGALKAIPGDGRSFLEQARLLISLGEYEKATGSLNSLFVRSQDRQLLLEGRYLAALLEAFRSNTQILAALADDPEFAEYRSGIFYTLWKLTGLPSWETRLSREFPRSPEAKIASASTGSTGGINSAPSPLWLLFPGRESIVLSTPQPSPAAQSAAPPPPAPGPMEHSAEILQTGLFGREENARSMAEQLKKAGFEPQITRRQLSGNDYWAVSVPGGRDMNNTIMRLKDAGFESFPIR